MTQVQNSKGFSIVEAMIVLAIMSILCTIARVSYDRYIYRSRVAQVESFAAQFEQYVLARSEADNIWKLQDITGSTCSACTFFGTAATMTNPTVIALWKSVGYDEVPMDGWGNAYVFDENMGEYGPADCRPDVVISGGPNGLQQTVGGGAGMYYTAGADDIIYPFKHQRNEACNGVIVF
jgi:prepilin-type N-terminal cleavage/methylation domain-containing protein